MARYIAKNIVAAGIADECEVQLAYAIGVADPVSIYVDTFGTGKVEQSRLVDIVREHFQMTPRGIIESLKLRRPIFKKTAAYGHSAAPSRFTWEATDNRTRCALLREWTRRWGQRPRTAAVWQRNGDASRRNPRIAARE
jgi:S-adenosylmethionine synthetase